MNFCVFVFFVRLPCRKEKLANSRNILPKSFSGNIAVKNMGENEEFLKVMGRGFLENFDKARKMCMHTG